MVTGLFRGFLSSASQTKNSFVRTKTGSMKALASIVFIILATLLCPSGASAFNEMIVFGDSLSDSGNDYSASGGNIPASPYYDGRFSNGPNYADDLAADLGLQLDASLQGGANFAYGGATAGGSSAGGLQFQLDSFFFEVTLGIIDPDENALYIVFIGQNDMLDLINEAQGDPQNQSTIIANGVSSVVENIESALYDLADQGAVNILVPNMPNLGRTPRFIQKESSSPGVIALATSVSLTFNQAVEAMLGSITGVNIIRFDTYNALEQVVADPAAYGFADVTSACYTGDSDYTGGGTVCANPEAYFFWDDIHPSANGHMIVADKILQVLTGQGGNPVQLLAGDFNGDGRAGLAELTSSGKVYYTMNRATWQNISATNIPGTLNQLVVGDFNGDGRDDLGGVTSFGQIYYTIDLATWQNIPGMLKQLTVGDFNADGLDDLAGLTTAGQIYYTVDFVTWQNIAGTLQQLVAGNFDLDTADELAGVTSSGQIFYTLDLATWQNIPGTLNQLVAADLSGNAVSDIAGATSVGDVYYTLNLSTWIGLLAPM